MSNVNSSGKFGTSMDYSQLLQIRRKYIGVNAMYALNSANDPAVKPHFNQDKMGREPQTNGAVDFYFTRGLFPLYANVGSSK